MSKFTKNATTQTVEILKYDHYLAVTCMVEADGVVAGADGKKVVPAGTILPANDATAKGVLLHDVDVTYGDAPGTMVIHGFIDNAKLVKAGINVSAAAMGVLRQIEFMGSETVPAINAASVDDGAITTDKIADDAITADKIADGAVTTTAVLAKNIDVGQLSDAVVARLNPAG